MLYPYLDQNVFCLFQSWLRLQQKSSLAWWGSWKAITPTGRDGYNWKHSKCRSCFICWCSNLALQLRAKVSYSIDSDHKEVLHFLEHKNEKNIVAASLYRCPTLKHTFQYSCPCEIPPLESGVELWFSMRQISQECCVSSEAGSEALQFLPWSSVFTLEKQASCGKPDLLHEWVYWRSHNAW